jgi:PAS domain-containing protein
VEDDAVRKAAELALQQRDEYFRTAFEYAPFGMALVTRDRRFQQVNATLCRMLGYSEAELLALNWTKISVPGDVSRTEAQSRAWSASGPSGSSTRSATCTRTDMSSGFGSAFLFRGQRRPVPFRRPRRGHHGTETRRGAIRSSEDRVRLLLDSTAEAIYGTDLEGVCTFANAASLRMLGYPDSQAVIGKNMHALTHHTRADGSPIPSTSAQATARLMADWGGPTPTTKYCGGPMGPVSPPSTGAIP